MKQVGDRWNISFSQPGTSERSYLDQQTDKPA